METSSDFGLTLIEEEELAGQSTYRGLMIKHKGLSPEAVWMII